MIGTDLQTVRLAIAAWEEGAFRVIDCKAIGGWAGEKNRLGWAGENGDRSDRALHPSHVAVGSIFHPMR
jgi:hypothetical protein